MKKLLVLLLALGAFAGVAYAHNGMQHVVGMVTSITGTAMDVKAADGTTQTVALTSDTKYLKANATATLKDIQMDDHVIIHATKKGDQLIAVEVWVGATKTKCMHGDMGGMKMDDNTGATSPK